MTDATAATEPAQGGGNDRAALYRRYRTEVDLWFKESKDWHDRGAKIIKRYRSDLGANESTKRRMNLLWSNVQTLLPALYSRLPKPVVERAYKDGDPVARVAASLLERAVERNIAQTSDFHVSMRAAVLDRLLPGRGTIWVRYLPTFKKVQPRVPLVMTEAGPIDPTTMQLPPADAEVMQEGGEAFMLGEAYDALDFEHVDVDYVDWKDFGHTAGARTWEEVRGVFRRTYMTRDQLMERFGEEEGAKVTLDYDPKNKPDDVRGTLEAQSYKKATVYEFWDREARKVVWFSESNKDDVLDERDDPLGLREFFPCPRPIYATLTNDSLIPVPDYKQYEDLAQEVDDLSDRISKLTKALAVKGAYNGEHGSILANLVRGEENDLIPVEAAAWAMFAQGGGASQAIQWFPLEMVSNTLTKLIELREVAKRAMFEVTGLSDIIRGQGSVAATATEQRIKGQFASLRLSDLQGEVQRFARDAVRLIAEIIAEKFQPDIIAEIGGAAGLGQDQQHVPAAIALLRNDTKRGFVIDIETDSTISADEQEEKAAVVELMTALGQFMTQWGPVVQQQPAMLPVVKELLMFAIRRYRAGRSLESTIEQAMGQLEQAAQAKAQQPPQPSPDEQRAQADMQLKQQEAQARLAADQQKAQSDLALARERMAADLQMQREEMFARIEMEREKAALDAETKLRVAAMQPPKLPTSPIIQTEGA